MRIAFFGSGEFGLPTLQALHEQHDVRLVVTQPDRPAGRRRRLTPTPIADWAQSHGLEVIKPQRANEPEVVEQVRAARADANVVVAFGQKIGEQLISSPRHGRRSTINLHASLLPKYRGAAPINWAILGGEKETGNTVFSLVERMDAGDILGQQRTQIDPAETAGELHDRLADMGPQLVLDVLSDLERGRLRPQPQDEAAVTMAPKLTRADACLDFNATADEVRRRVHGLTPWPGVTVWWQADSADRPRSLILRRVEALDDEEHGEPGRMIEDGVISASRGAVRLLEVQPPGKRLMSWEQYQRGHAVPSGALFSGKRPEDWHIADD